jgi:hypothetical protein
MANGTPESLKVVLGNVCIATSSNPTRKTPKLRAARPGSEEAYYMLAAFCFDLTRKVKYIFDATKEFGIYADPAFKQRALAATEAINDSSLTTWKQRAELAETLMHEMYDATSSDYAELGGKP